MPKRHGSSDSYRFGFNGMEKDDETYGVSGTAYDFGARIYSSRLGRWLATDPLEMKYPNLSPYNFVANMPTIAVDPDGKKIRLYFESDEAKEAYKTFVNQNLKGKYEIDYKEVKDDEYGYTTEVVLKKTDSNDVLSEREQAFVDAYVQVAGDKEIVSRHTIAEDHSTPVGGYRSGIIDMSDVNAFDAAGKGGASSAGVFIHETVEQYEKAKLGLGPYEGSNDPSAEKDIGNPPPEYFSTHNKANNVENKVNGNIKGRGNNENYFYESDGTVTHQSLEQKNGKFNVDKKKVKKENAPPKPTSNILFID